MENRISLTQVAGIQVSIVVPIKGDIENHGIGEKLCVLLYVFISSCISGGTEPIATVSGSTTILKYSSAKTTPKAIIHHIPKA